MRRLYVTERLLRVHPTQLTSYKEFNGFWEVLKNTTEKICFLHLYQIEKKKTLLSAFKKYIMSASVLVTDGYSSYVSAVRDFDYQHIVVNHTLGFKNEKGYTKTRLKTFGVILRPCTELVMG
jgi:hypothetical protein